MKKSIALALAAFSSVALADQVFNDDVIVDGSQCVGMDCTNGINFGFDTLILKENNLRMFFDDTSSSGSFPSIDWRFTFNDSNNGGSNYFSVDNASTNATPFKIMSGAGNNAVVIDGDGDFGIGTSTPVLELQVTDGDSPGLRLEQNSSAGWTSQTWDIAGNETNFFVRDVTNGSRLPFKIRPGAATGSIDITASGVKIPKIQGSVDINNGSSNADLTISGDLGTWTLRNNGDTGRLTIRDEKSGNTPIKIFNNANENLIKFGSPAADIVKIDGDIYLKASDGNFISLQELIDVVEALNGSALTHK